MYLFYKHIKYDIIFSINKDKIYRITARNISPATVIEELVIPSFYKDKAGRKHRIREIGMDVFRTRSGNQAGLSDNIIRRVIISNGIEKIEKCAFYGSRIEEVRWSASCSRIPDKCFCGCSDLRKIDFTGNIERIGKDCFKDTSVTELDLMSSLSVLCEDKSIKVSGINIIPPYYGSFEIVY